MSKKKSFRRALLTGGISLGLCVSMFVGTTFAWFTDSVNSANNVIRSGNLDVELDYLDAEDGWTPVTGTTNVFTDNYWEPGHTEVVYLKISNAGSLAFNYKLGVNIVEEKTSINVYGEELQLSEYIMMGAVEGVKQAYATRGDARSALNEDEVKAIKSGYAQDGVLYSATDTPVGEASVDYVALVVYMPETIENEANHRKGEEPPMIKLGISLLATQKTYEKDGFGDDYDENANTTAPPVPVEPDTFDVTVYDVFDANKQKTDLEDVTMDVYSFIAEQYQDVYPVETYKDWTCDFFVSTDRAVAEGLALIGNYGDWGWLGFWVPESDEAYEPIGLLGTVSYGGESNWNYQGICNDVQIFRCGLLDYEHKNAGVNVTVELRMTSPDKTRNITVRSITVTLK